MIQDYFPGYIGQPKLKNKLSFLLDNHRKTKMFEPVLLVSKRGDGKSDLARRIGSNILNFDNTKPRKFIEVNSASVASITAFCNDILIPHVAGNQETTLFCDEFATINKKVENWLLSVLCPNAEGRTTAFHDGAKYDFDYRYFTFIGATTDARLLSLPMKSRLRRLEFEPYSHNDLIRILFKNTPNVIFRDDIEMQIVKVLRGSPRTTVLMAKDINQYVESKNVDKIFNQKDWDVLRHIMDVLPYGLTRNELQLLKFLREGPMTLTGLAAKFALEPSELRRDIELFALSLGLIAIDGKRILTARGREALETIGE